MVNRLHRKLLRDIRAAFWQFLSISLVAALGVALFHGSLVGYLNQKTSYAVSYERLGFADVTVALRRAPRALVLPLARLPGVHALEARIVEDIEVEQIDGRRPRVIGRLVTVPTGREPTVNRFRLLEGRPLAHVQPRELLLEASFAQANHYRPGDRLRLKFGGRRVTFTVAGIVTSPEYIYPIPSSQVSIPMPETFGVMFVQEGQVAPFLGMTGFFNEVALLAEPGRAKAVGETIAHRLRAYGAQKPLLQADQPSNKLLQSDLEGNKPFLIVMPTLFLGSAALAVGLVLARWVQSQRAQIGFLRASGFPARAVLHHYLEAGLIVGASGGLIGVVLGHLLGLWVASVYEQFLRMPYAAREPHPEVAALAFSLSVLACLLGALGPARMAARLTPAEAMRGQMPARPWWPVAVKLPLAVALPLRNMLRRPLRTIGTAAGVACAVVLLILAGCFRDSLEEMIRLYLRDIQRYDLSVAFVPERSQNVVFHLNRWPGVRRAEPTLDIAVRVVRGEAEKETAAIGVLPNTRLRRLPSFDGLPLLPLPGTVLFGGTLAARLRAAEGDLLRLTYTQNTTERRADADVRAGPLVHDPVGLPVYMRLDELQRRFARPLGMPPDAVNGALMEVDPSYTASLQTRLQRMDGVALVQTKRELQRELDRLTDFSRTFIAIMFLFGASMAFAVVYTATEIVLWERTREMATLRSLGFGMQQVTTLVTVENLLTAGLGALLGILPGQWTADYLMQASATEGFTLQTIILPRSYLMAIGGALGVVLLAQWPGLRRIRRLNLAASIRLRDE